MKQTILFLMFISLVCSCCNQKTSDVKTDQPQQEEPTARGGGGKPKPPPVTNIPAPTGLKVTVINSTTAYIEWDAVPGATTYWIYRNGYVPAIVPTLNYTDKALVAGTTYTYQVAAVVSENLGPKSNSVTVTTPN